MKTVEQIAARIAEIEGHPMHTDELLALNAVPDETVSCATAVEVLRWVLDDSPVEPFEPMSFS